MEDTKQGKGGKNPAPINHEHAFVKYISKKYISKILTQKKYRRKWYIKLRYKS